MAKSSFGKPGAAAPPAAKKPAPAPPPKATPAKKTTPPAKAVTPAKPLPEKRITPPGIRSNAPDPGPTVVEAEVEVLKEELPTGVADGDEIIADENERALAVIEPNTRLATHTPHALGMPIGEIDASDQDIPFLKLAQGDEGSSPLIDAWLEAKGENINGAWVLAADTIIWQDGWEPIEFTILRYEKAFMQQLDYGTDEYPKLYKHAADAQADGLIPFGGHEVGYLSYAELVVLIKQPAYELSNINDQPTTQFTEEFGDELYAIALWRITGTAYKFGAKKILGQLRTRLRGGFLTGSIKLEARKEKGKLKTYWVPQIRDGEMHDEEALAFITDLATRYDSSGAVE